MCLEQSRGVDRVKWWPDPDVDSKQVTQWGQVVTPDTGDGAAVATETIVSM